MPEPRTLADVIAADMAVLAATVPSAAPEAKAVHIEAPLTQITVETMSHVIPVSRLLIEDLFRPLTEEQRADMDRRAAEEAAARAVERDRVTAALAVLATEHPGLARLIEHHAHVPGRYWEGNEPVCTGCPPDNEEGAPSWPCPDLYVLLGEEIPC